MLSKQIEQNEDMKKEEGEVETEPVAPEEPVDVMYWQQNCLEGVTLLRVSVKANADLDFGDKVRCTVYLDEAEGVVIPLSGMTKDNVDATNWTVMGHFEVKTPGSDVGKVRVRVETEMIKAPKYKTSTSSGGGGYSGNISV